ncbi:hypothetical protein KEM56_005233 [Ascosphaera pollenicola]|nr:hypothetical protein KEM56_005233 [Ascosphaera pollenicola]
MAIEQVRSRESSPSRRGSGHSCETRHSESTISTLGSSTESGTRLEAAEGVLAFSSPLTAHDSWTFTNATDEKHHHRERWLSIANFHPGWFGATMGTGMVGTNLANNPYQFNRLQYITDVVFGITVFFFVFFTLISLVRYYLWPKKLIQTLYHPSQSLTLAMYPLTISMICNLWNARMTVHQVQLVHMTGAWLLPAVAAAVCAGSGAITAYNTDSPNRALICMVAAYILWGMSVPLAFLMIGVYFQRLILYNLVPEVSMATSMIPVGPLGQGAFCIMQLGLDCRKVFPQLNLVSPVAGEVLYAGGLITGLTIWGIGVVWLWFAVAAFATKRFSFNLGWWALIFPFGALNIATCTLAAEFGFRFFRVLATITTIILTILWILVTALTTVKTITKEILR